MTPQRNTQAHRVQLLFAGLLLALLSGCASLPRNPVPVNDIHRAEIPGMSGVRAWAG